MTPPTADGLLYPARVAHRRRVAPLYRFVYRLFYLLVDIDRLDTLERRLWGFSVDRFNLVSLRTRDFGDGSGNLRGWAERQLSAAGIDLAGGRIRLLVLPRILGYGFNPISIWYCDHADGHTRAVIAEVHNTFGERHSYLLASADRPFPYGEVQDKDKCFHVSPFFDLVGRYHFRLSPPAARLRVAIHESRDGIPIIDTVLAAEQASLTSGSLLLHVLRMPWMTLKVITGIHWEALKLWLRGARFHRKPAPPDNEIS